MIRARIIATACAWLMIAMQPALAEATADVMLKLYDTKPDQRQPLERVFGQVYLGFGWANTLMKTRGQEPLFCEHPKVMPTGNQLIDILKRERAGDDLLGTQPYGLALLTALQRAFSCPDSQYKSL
jgi:hypothetical protein